MRGSPYPPLRDRWQQTIALGVSAAATTTLAQASDLLYTPFRIEHLWIESDRTPGSPSWTALWAVTQGVVDDTNIDARLTAMFTNARSTQSTVGAMMGAAGMGPIQVGKIIRRVPSRIVLININTLGVTVSVQGLASITLLEEIADVAA